MTSMVMARTPQEGSDENLAEAARAGDPAAYASLVARYRAVAIDYAFARLRDREEAEDIAQEAFVRAYVALDRFRLSASWAPWVMRILRNLCTDALRRRRRKPLSLCDDEDTPAGIPSPEQLALASERQRELHRAIAALPEKYRIPLVMHYGSGHTYREIAVALGLPESTVVGRLAGALRILRRRLNREGE